jgi:hypothetical protein
MITGAKTYHSTEVLVHFLLSIAIKVMIQMGTNSSVLSKGGQASAVAMTIAAQQRVGNGQPI